MQANIHFNHIHKIFYVSFHLYHSKSSIYWKRNFVALLLLLAVFFSQLIFQWPWSILVKMNYYTLVSLSLFLRFFFLILDDCFLYKIIWVWWLMLTVGFSIVWYISTLNNNISCIHHHVSFVLLCIQIHTTHSREFQMLFICFQWVESLIMNMIGFFCCCFRQCRIIYSIYSAFMSLSIAFVSIQSNITLSTNSL